MCRKPSQTFNFPGAVGAVAGLPLLSGAGVLTDVIPSASNPSIGAELILRDGNSKEGRIIYRAFVQQVGDRLYPGTNMGLEFESGLFIQTTQPGPNFVDWTIAGFIQDRSPDPMSIQLQRIADELARVTAKRDKQIADFSDFVKGLQLGNPAK